MWALPLVVVVANGLPLGLPLLLPRSTDAPPRLAAILDGRMTGSLNGDDVLALERYVGDGAAVVRGVAAAVDDVDREGCTLSSDAATMQAEVGHRLLATALLEAARERAGTAMALATAADFAIALRRCLPFGIAESVAQELAHHTAALASYLRSHGALDDEDASSLAPRLEAVVQAKAATLRRPTVVLGALVLVPAAVLCRRQGGRTVLSAGEAREIGRRYQGRPPSLSPVFGPRGVEGLRLATDAFLRSCGFVDDETGRVVSARRRRRPGRARRRWRRARRGAWACRCRGPPPGASPCGPLVEARPALRHITALYMHRSTC